MVSERGSREAPGRPGIEQGMGREETGKSKELIGKSRGGKGEKQ